LEAATVTTERWGQCWDNYYKEMDPSQELHICAVCCERRYDMEMCKHGGSMSLSELTLLKVDIEKVAEYESKTDDMKKAYNYYKSSDDTLYHLLSFLLQESVVIGPDCTSSICSFPVCLRCSNRIKENKIPEYSLADGHDYGNPRAVIGDVVDKLSVVDDMCIAKNRMFANIIKLLGATGAGVSNPSCAFKGHVISFSHDAPTRIAERTKRTLPNTDSLGWIRVCFIGSKNTMDTIKNTPSLQTVFSVNASAIMKCLAALKVVNERYTDMIIMEDSMETATMLSELQVELAASIMCDESDFIAAMEEATTSDIANVRTDSPGEDFEHILISSNHLNGHRRNV
jgi:hypothetical protein